MDPAVRHQTILGRGKTTPWLPAAPLLRDQCIDRAVNDLGVNRLRFEGMGGNKVGHRSWESVAKQPVIDPGERPFDLSHALGSRNVLGQHRSGCSPVDLHVLSTRRVHHFGSVR